MTTAPMSTRGFVRHVAPKGESVGHHVPGLSDAYRTADAGDLRSAAAKMEAILEDREIPLEIRIHLRRTLMEWYADMAQPVPAAKLATENAREACDAYGECDEMSLMMRSSELYWKSQAGYAKDAARRFPKLRRDVERTLGRHDTLAYAVRNNSAMPHKVMGEYAEAVEIYDELLVDLRKKLKPSDPVVLTTRDNLAEVLAADGQLERSSEEYGKVMRGLLEAGSADDPRVLRIRHEIASNTHAMGDEVEAREMWSVLVEDCRRYLGECHEETARQRMLQVLLAVEQRDSEAVVMWCERLLDNLPPAWPAEEAAVFRQLLDEHREIVAKRG